MDTDGHTDAQIRAILSLRNVAVVGMSRDPRKAAHYVPRYLLGRGYSVAPVNPAAGSILGLECRPRVSDVPGTVDVVDVFRPAGQVAPVVADAAAKRPRVLWLQEGIHDPPAEAAARDAGMDVVFDRCMLAERRRLFGDARL